MNEKQRKLEQARELIRSVWTDDLAQDIQDEQKQIGPRKKRPDGHRLVLK